MRLFKNIGLLGIIGMLLVAGCDLGINHSIELEAGREARQGTSGINGNVVVGERAVVQEGDLKTVNGRIEIKHGAKVNRCATVNGSLTVEAEAETGDLESVNGHLKVDRNAKVKGNVKLVNGGVTVQSGAKVLGDIGTVNGAIELYGATVEGALKNYSGGMTITKGSVVKGGISVHKPARYDRSATPTTIVIGPDSIVEGDMSFERPVRLFIHETATVGQIHGADPIRYSGELPAEG